MPRAIIKKCKGVSRSVNSSQPSGSSYVKAVPPKTPSMTEFAAKRETRGLCSHMLINS